MLFGTCQSWLQVVTLVLLKLRKGDCDLVTICMGLT